MSSFECCSSGTRRAARESVCRVENGKKRERKRENESAPYEDIINSHCGNPIIQCENVMGVPWQLCVRALFVCVSILLERTERKTMERKKTPGFFLFMLSIPMSSWVLCSMLDFLCVFFPLAAAAATHWHKPYACRSLTPFQICTHAHVQSHTAR